MREFFISQSGARYFDIIVFNSTKEITRNRRSTGIGQLPTNHKQAIIESTTRSIKQASLPLVNLLQDTFDIIALNSTKAINRDRSTANKSQASNYRKYCKKYQASKSFISQSDARYFDIIALNSTKAIKRNRLTTNKSQASNYRKYCKKYKASKSSISQSDARYFDIIVFNSTKAINGIQQITNKHISKILQEVSSKQVFH
ncbi:hypothetical protein CEXT_667891 [Caerostris extrusa]|uniref:(d)CMP kinase n=1 Tax=Caerostris extrusa TaxID=172846 RepID=A0AAV4SCD0_CAEEX|nr:hypothetical protein CEXT_667891 [Caerostris extrusa]